MIPPSATDKLDGGSLVAAVLWFQDLVLGPAATVAAVLAVALIGGAMLTGRLPVRRGVTTIVGCFILFSAGQIASGIRSSDGPMVPAAEPTAVPVYVPSAPKPVPYDPYAGASVPMRSGEQMPIIR